MGFYKKALALLSKTLVFCNRVLDPDDPDIANVMSHIAMTQRWVPLKGFHSLELGSLTTIETASSGFWGERPLPSAAAYSVAGRGGANQRDAVLLTLFERRLARELLNL